MSGHILQGIQYVRLGPGAAEAIAPYLGRAPWEIRELVLDLDSWPEEVQPPPLVGRGGRLLAGDPTLLGADDRGLCLSGGRSAPAVLVPWRAVRLLEVLSAPRYAGSNML